MTKFLEANMGIRISTQNFIESFVGAHGFEIPLEFYASQNFCRAFLPKFS
jgi:hypothetical protein